jgi:PilZ domain
MARLSSAISLAEDPGERRNFERQTVAIWARVRYKGVVHPLRVTDISPGGLRAATPGKIPSYAEVEIEFPTLGWCTAMFVWQSGDEIGAEFEPRLNPAVLDRFLAFHKQH